MRRRTLQVLTLLLLLTAVAPQAIAEPVDGVVDAASPVTLEGILEGRTADPTLVLGNADLGVPERPLILHAEHLTLTRRTYDIERVESGFYDVVTPNSRSSEETFQVQEATLEIAAMGREADLLLSPGTQTGLLVAFQERHGTAQLDARSDDLRVVDGYQKTVGDREAGYPRDFEYVYERPGPLTVLDGVQAFTMTGAAHGYVWDAHVQVRNATGVIATFDTGRSTDRQAGGSIVHERFEYLLLDMEGFRAQLAPGGLSAGLYMPSARVHLAGVAELPDAQGTFTAGEDLYRATGSTPLLVEGNLTLDATPRTSSQARNLPAVTGANTGERVVVRLDGQLSSTNLAPLNTGSILTDPAVVVGAGGATALGLVAAWYVLGAKGASAMLLARPGRREEEEGHRAEALDPEVSQPADLLFDTDRFTLYHLIEARMGLSPSECRELTGIENVGEQLDLLARQGLLQQLSEDPPRYALPGAVTEEQRELVCFLREPCVRTVASLLALHGLMPESLLRERVGRARDGSRAELPWVLNRMEASGLVIRETGTYGPVVDPTDELFTCLRIMGEPAVRAA